MLVSQVISLARSSELRQLAVKDDVDAVIGFINLGMLELHKRFTLVASEAIITLRTGKSIYKLDGTDPDVSMVNPSDFLIVTECYDEQGDLVPINDEDSPLGIMTPTYNTVEVIHVAQGEKLSVIYRSSCPFIKYTTDVLALPPQLLESLLHYVGYRGHSTISADVKAENNTHYIRFDRSCAMVTEQGLSIQDDLESYKMYNRGFV